MSSSPSARRRRPHPLLELTRARILEFVREPEAWFWTFVFPVLLAIVLGVAFRARPPEKLHVAVVRELAGCDAIVASLERSPDLAVSVLSAAEAQRALVVAKLDLVIAAPASGAPRPALPYTYRLDPTRTEARTARIAVDDALAEARGEHPPARAETQAVSELGSRYVDFLIPGLIGLNLMGSGMWGLGFAVVQARVSKLLKRFAATPMRRLHFLLSFMLSRLLWLIGEVVVLVGAGRLIFDLPIRGSLLTLSAVALAGAVMFAGLGLLVAARPLTLEGVSGLVNLVQLPMWLFSGTFFAYQRFPTTAQPVIRLLPLTALNDALRRVILEGVPLHACWHELSVMTVWILVSFAVALRTFRWQ
jgi:ABC-2 type transport system permease protein